MKIGVAQTPCSTAHDPRTALAENLEVAVDAIGELASSGCELVVFGECFLSGYSDGARAGEHAVAESAADPHVAALIDCAARNNTTVVMGAITSKGPFPGSVYNSALVVGPGGLLGVYNKTHLATVEVDGEVAAIERAWFAPGAELRVFDTPVGKIGLEICYDVFFPEVARTLALGGAELIINIAAPYRDPHNEDRWDHLLFARAMENSIPYLHACIVGRQGSDEYFGGSRLVAPTGVTIAEAPRYEPSLAVFELERHLITRVRRQLNPFANRNTAAYRL